MKFKNIDIEKLIYIFEFEFGLKLFKNTRKREYVEARAVFIYYLYNYCNLRLTDIVNAISKHSGRTFNHATILHSIKNYEVYTRYNTYLEERLFTVVNKVDNKKDKTTFIKYAISKMPDDVIEEMYIHLKDKYTEIIDANYESKKAEDDLNKIKNTSIL
tara:strand:- start:4036 stop:4512 length:477 start_codon:yes stop_codon:yes gene_type:complete